MISQRSKGLIRFRNNQYPIRLLLIATLYLDQMQQGLALFHPSDLARHQLSDRIGRGHGGIVR